MAVNPALIKAAIYVATDKRFWTILLSIIIGAVMMIVAVTAVFLNMFSYDDTASTNASPAYVQFVSNMKDCYLKLDGEVAILNGKIEGEQLDYDRIHAVFYMIYFGEEKSFTQVSSRCIRSGTKWTGNNISFEGWKSNR